VGESKDLPFGTNSGIALGGAENAVGGRVNWESAF
jgi:hypothetical protein